jgi:putative component of membrane protein insertase Oxa1/YidC/SpoIIIJ protein YidD
MIRPKRTGGSSSEGQTLDFSGKRVTFFRTPFFRTLLVLPAVLFTLSALAQAGDAGDLTLISRQSFSTPDEFAHYHGPANNEKALQSRRRNVIAQYNPVSLLLKGALLGYQKILSQQLARNCPYEISCSNFSKQAIREFGAFKGVFISADRILRCNRIGFEDVSPLSINPATGRIIDSPNMYR